MNVHVLLQTPESTLPDGTLVSKGLDLVLADLGEYDSGVYECTAENDAGTEIKALAVQVMCK